MREKLSQWKSSFLAINDLLLVIGISRTRPGGTNWQRIGGLLKQVSVSPRTNNVWGVNRRNQIFYRNGAHTRNPVGM